MRINYYISRLFEVIYDRCTTLLMRLKLRLDQVEFGHHVSFWGVAKIIRGRDTSISIGNNCQFRSRPTSNLIGVNRPCILSTLSPGANLIIGDNCGISGVVIGCFKHIKIGNGVRAGANVLITDSDWHLDDSRSGAPKEVCISDNVWLGEGCKILKGVTIGENTVIGAGAIVTKPIPANVIAAGNPCEIIKHI